MFKPHASTIRCKCTWLVISLTAGCALPAGGGNSSAVEGALSESTGGQSSNPSATGGESATGGANGGQSSTTSSLDGATGGQSATGGADGGQPSTITSVGGTSSGGSSSPSTALNCVIDADSSAGSACNCVAGTVPVPKNAIVRGGSREVPKLGATPFDVCTSPEAYLVTIPANSVAGYGFNYFDAGDVIYSIGALTSLINQARPIDFQMALYTDVDGKPGSRIYLSPALTTTDTTSGEAAPEDFLPCPLRVVQSGFYWLVMFVSDKGDAARIYMHNQNVSEQIAWAKDVTPATPPSEWLQNFQPKQLCTKTSGIYPLGNYPHFFVQLTSGKPSF